MAQTRSIAVRIPDALLTAAREQLGLSTAMRDSDIVRSALAAVGGLDLAEHTPKRTGRPRQKGRAA